MWKYELRDLSIVEDDFLIALASQTNREIYAKIIALDIDELPIESIEGKVTTGSINVDGSSAIRRTCSLTMVAEDVDINDFYWGIKTKIKLEIGLKNNLVNQYAFRAEIRDQEEYYPYPDIVWFPQGVFMITSFNTSISTSGYTITLQGKDKMCLLNGELSGQMYASIDFGTEEYKEVKMTPISLIVDSSQELVNNKYYYLVLRKDNPLDYISSTDTLYEFVKTNQESSFDLDSPVYFYRKGNFFYKEIQNGQNPIEINNNEEVINKYLCYKLMTNPDEIFDSLNDLSLNEIYYYRKTVNSEIIDAIYNRIKAGETFQNINEYYLMKDLYELEYSYTIKKIPLYKIILESVHTYANEPYHNIIINDLSNFGLEQLTYRGEEPLLALRRAESTHFSQLMFENRNQQLKDIVEDSTFNFDSLTSDNTNTGEGTIVSFNKTQGIYNDPQPENTDEIINYRIAKITYGTDIGYRLTDLVYAGDLISSIGESLTSILDKIKNMLGDFEYFYDLNGHFVFQRKKTFVNTTWTHLVQDSEQNQDYNNNYVDFMYSSRDKFSFNFEGNTLLTAINNSPNLANVKNDFSVWGKRTNIMGADVPIHVRYAIDKKPKRYQAFDGNLYVTAAASAEDKQMVSIPGLTSGIVKQVDWRELIYQMAIDYFAAYGCSENQPVFNENKEIVLINPDQLFSAIKIRNPVYFPNGKTGYEQYYTDMQGFWRQLYNPDYLPSEIYENGYYEDTAIKLDNSQFFVKTNKWEESRIKDLDIQYYVYRPDPEMVSSLTDHDLYINNQYERLTDGYADHRYDFFWKNKYYKYYLGNKNNPRLYWNRNVFECPEALNFWIEFLDSESELSQFSIPVIGDRSKTVNDDKVRGVYFKEIPDLILYEDRDKEENDYSGLKQEVNLNWEIGNETGYTFIFLPPGLSKYFTISSRGISGKDKIDDLLYQFAYCIENITLTTIPIYYLEPNTRIYVYDKNTGINGEYVVNKITVPLTYNGTMSINATKAQERLY